MNRLKKLPLLLFLLTFAAFGRAANAAQPDFSASVKTVNKSATYLTDTVQYTVKLDNTLGTTDALDVVFTDHLPPGIDVQLFSLDGIPQVLTLLSDGLTVGTIPAGTSRTVTIVGVVTGIPAQPNIAHYVNQASWTYRYRPTAGAPKVNATYTTNTATSNMVRLEPSMAIATVALAPILNLGNEITYTITVPNTGTLNSAGTTLTDLIPVGAIYVANSTKLNGAPIPDVLGLGGVGLVGPYTLGGLINSPGEPAGQINVGEAATITFKATSLLLPVVNVTLVDPDGLGPIPPLNLNGSTATVLADLAVTNTDGQVNAIPGTNTTYTITVKNNGPTTLNGVHISDTLPLTLSNPVWTPSTGTYNAGSGDWTGLNLANGQSVTLTMTAKVSPLAVGTLVHTVAVSTLSGVTDSNATNNSATDTDTLISQADLAVAQTDGVTSITAGAPVTYTITVSNNGPGTVLGFTLIDTAVLTLQNPVFTPDEGSYNAATGAWTGINLAQGGTLNLTLTGTVSTLATGTQVDTVTVTAPLGTTDLVTTNNTAIDIDTIILGATVSGTVYLDANHNAIRDGNEAGLGTSGLFAKLIPQLGGNALQVGAVDATTGAYQFTGVIPGTYSIILDDNATLGDTTAALPAGYLGTESQTQLRGNVLVALVALPNQNFGLWHGSQIKGTVWNDNGAGGGSANDNVQNGGEINLSGVTVKAASGATVYDSTTTAGDGSFTLWIPNTAGALQIVQTPPTGYIAINGRAGNSGGTYDQPTNAIAFTPASGILYSGLGFSDVPVNAFGGNQSQNVEPGSVAFFAHTFTAGSAGQVTFGVTQTTSPNMGGWNVLLYRDTNKNGVVDAGEMPLTGAVTLASGESVALIAKVFTPSEAPSGTQSQVALTSNFQYTGVAPALTSSVTLTDTVTIGASQALALTQSVDKVQAKSGDVITYTFTYRNSSAQSLTGVSIRNTTAPYTTFVAATYGALSAGLTGCTIVPPAVGSRGDISWNFTGTLAPGGSGTLSFQVKVD